MRQEPGLSASDLAIPAPGATLAHTSHLPPTGLKKQTAARTAEAGPPRSWYKLWQPEYLDAVAGSVMALVVSFRIHRRVTFRPRPAGREV